MDPADSTGGGEAREQASTQPAQPTRGPPCLCCCDLDVALVDKNNSNVSVDKRDRMLCIRRDLVQIEEYANSGCQSCLVIHKITQFFGLKRTATAKRCNVYLRLPIDPGNPEVSFWPSGIESGVIVQLYTHISDLKTWRNIRPLPEICPDHMSPESISFIKACLRTCRESHPLCRKTEARLPTRVLDIGDTRDGHIRLIESLGFMAAEYVALSYCWGNAVAMRTLVENLETMKSGIAISELPPAYLDAVLLTRQLGIRYLWIDALCIIQDSEEDWEKECSVMCDTYSRATLTVAAASSTSAAEHFLRPLLRPQSYAAQYNPNVFSERIRDGEDSVWIRARAILKTGAHWRWGHSDNERPLLEPLTKRGWTLQERLLSTRLLSIAATEMEWTCKEAVFCECRSRLNHQREFGRMPLWRITEASDAFNFWHKVVENYSKRELTKPRDKLPAISAVASVIQRRIESNYAAGLWTDNIDLDLLWRRSDSVRETPQSEYIAPTFSWASIHGEIDYYCFRNGKERYDKASSVLSVETNGCTESHLGRVESGQLTIRGPLAQGVMAALSEDGLLSVLVGGKSLVFGIDAQLQALTIPETSRSVTTACRWNESNAGQALTARHMSDSAVTCWVLRLGSFPFPRPTKPRGLASHEVLVLGRSPTRADVYERLGMGSVVLGAPQPGVDYFQWESTTTITIV